MADEVVVFGLDGGVGVGVWKRKEIGGLISKSTEEVGKRMPDKLKKAGEGIAIRIRSIRRSLRGEKRPNISNLIDALSGAIKLDELDILDKASPVREVFKGNRTPLMVNSELQNSEAEHMVDKLVDMAKGFGRWVPWVTQKGQDPYGLETPQGYATEGMGLLIKKGLVKMTELTDGKKLFAPTEEFVGFLKRHMK